MLDFASWDRMLQNYVNEQGLVDYARWQQESAEDLDRWLLSVNSVDIRKLDRESTIAFLINLYNALTIQQVLKKYPIPSIQPKFLGIPNWLAFLRFFTQKIYTLNGQALSLNAIEHDLLRSRFQEPRIHFALVCASGGCPLLRSEAYVPERLMAQLTEDAERFIKNPDKVRYDEASKTLYCSKIFKWYGADFRSAAGSIPAYISRYFTGIRLPEPVAIAYLPYSWDLNQRTSS
jgi:Protein of unknown function, DUF547